MDLKFGLNDKPRFRDMMLYSVEWFVLAVAVVITTIFIAQGTPGEKVLYAQKMFVVMGGATLLQALFGHRMPLVVGPASVLLIGILTALASQGDTTNTDVIYTSILLCGALLAVIAAGGLLKYIQRIFTPRIVVVIMMLLSFTLAGTIKNLIFPAHLTEQHTFGLIFTVVAIPLMALLSTRLRGIIKSLVIPTSLLVGTVIYYLRFGGFNEAVGRFSEPSGSLIIPNLEFNWGIITAFMFCFIALLINDVGSIQALGSMVKASDMNRRVNRGVFLTGVLNFVAGGLGVIGPVNYSLSPGVVAGSRCASRYTIMPAAILLIICGLIPQMVAVFAAIPDTIIGVILLYLMGTQLAAAFHVMVAERNVLTFNDGLIIGLPVMIALLFAIIPAEVVPQILRPIVQNGFVMGVITVILMEHIFLKEKKLQ